LRFLLDESVSPLVRDALAAGGLDVVHVHDIGLTSAPDPAVLDAAVSEGRVLITLDTDFGALAARSRSQPASVILFRGHVTRRPSAQASLLFANLEQLTEDLHAGAIVVIGDDRVRVRRLPIEPTSPADGGSERR
jgi:predicted nuclease of predicted toxin-antitoxin system